MSAVGCDRGGELLRVPAHPVALLEPGLQLVIGAILLGWLQSGPTGMVLGWALIGAGFVFVGAGPAVNLVGTDSA